jgi:hypothetical protein
MLWDLRLPLRYHSRSQQLHLHPVWQQLDAHKPLPAPGAAPPSRARKADAAAAKASVTSVLFLNGDRQLATAAAADTTVRFWDTRKLSCCLQTLQPKLLPMNCLDGAAPGGGARAPPGGFERLAGSLRCRARGDKAYGVLNLALAPQGAWQLRLRVLVLVLGVAARAAGPGLQGLGLQGLGLQGLGLLPGSRSAAQALRAGGVPAAAPAPARPLAPAPPHSCCTHRAAPALQATSCSSHAPTTPTTCTTHRRWARSPPPCWRATAAPPTTWTPASAPTAAWLPAARRTATCTCGA